MNKNINKLRKLTYISISAMVLVAIFILSGCTARNVIEPVQSFFSKAATEEEQTAAASDEISISYAQVNDAKGNALKQANGQPVTVMIAFETATGGEVVRDEYGDILTHPNGEVVTYSPGSPVTGVDGETETYSGGEGVYDILGIPEADKNGEMATRAEGEVVTHGKEEIVTDENGKRVTYLDEPLTHVPGELMYDEYGELATYAVTPRVDTEGRTIITENGNIQLQVIELMTDAAGNPIITDTGEVETRQANPLPPEQKFATQVESGNYYIYNPNRKYVYFSCPEVYEADIEMVNSDDEYSNNYYSNDNEEEAKKVNNLQLEMLGENLPYFEVNYDAEGYAYFTMQGTDQLLTISGDVKSGANIILADKVEIPYPQYEHWDDPLCTVANNQKWILKPVEVTIENGTEAGRLDSTETFIAYKIVSAADESLVMTLNDDASNQYANVMVWEEDGREQQLFCFNSEVPTIPQVIEPGDYFIRSGLTNWMVMSIAGWSTDDGANIQLATANGGEGQIMTISYDEYGFATISHNGSNKVVSVENGEAINGQNVGQYTGDGKAWQKWIFESIGDEGGVIIRSALNYNEVLDLTNGNTNDGANIATYWNNSSYAQVWYFLTEVPEVPASNETFMDEYAQNFSSESEYLILVDNVANVVGVYTGEKNHWVKLFSWSCCTGKASTPTVKGEFSIYTKLYSFDGNMDSPCWYTCYYASPFYGGYYFHSVIYYQGTWDLMDGTLGYNVSHGCVRLETDNAKWIWDNCPVGTKVVSY